MNQPLKGLHEVAFTMSSIIIQDDFIAPPAGFLGFLPGRDLDPAQGEASGHGDSGPGNCPGIGQLMAYFEIC